MSDWISRFSKDDEHIYVCGNCGCEIDESVVDSYKFCPGCGAFKEGRSDNRKVRNAKPCYICGSSHTIAYQTNDGEDCYGEVKCLKCGAMIKVPGRDLLNVTDVWKRLYDE